MKITNEQYDRLVSLLSELSRPDGAMFFNGDKRKLFDSIARIETKLEGLDCVAQKKRISRLEKEVNTNTVIRKTRWTGFVTMFTVIASISSLAMTIIIYIQFAEKIK